MKDELKENIQTIIIVICISIIIGIILWVVYDKTFGNISNDNIEKFEGDMSGIEETEKTENMSDEDFFMTQEPKNKFQLNNNRPLRVIKDWAKVTVNHEEAVGPATYSIPGDTANLKGRNIFSRTIEMNYLLDETTYEEYIQTFLNTIKNRNFSLGAEYSTRQIKNGNQTFYIIMEKTEYWVNSYFCLAKDGYTYYLTIIVDKLVYNDSLEKTLDKIFCTYVIN